MGKRELTARELDRMPEQEAEADMPMRATESSLVKDWLTPEEDAAWANL
jgi:hypothetical protein